LKEQSHAGRAPTIKEGSIGQSGFKETLNKSVRPEPVEGLVSY